jgi:hypothetical protein
MVTKVRIDPGICKFITVVKAEKKQNQEIEISIASACPNLGHFKEAVKTVKMYDTVNLPKVNFILQKAAESIPHSSCAIPIGVIKACEAEIKFALKREVKIEFMTEDMKKKSE